jgi:putative membrane protein
MAVIRTSLSLIGFGFTIFQVFRKLYDAHLLIGGEAAPRNFGRALIFLGVAMLVVGIAYHSTFMLAMRRERAQLTTIHAKSKFPVSGTLLVALALLVIGVLAITSMTFHIGPFE